jgi:hypothetical protein
MSIQWSLEFTASQPEATYLDWLRTEPGFVGPVEHQSHPEFRIGSMFVTVWPAAEDPNWADDFERMYGFRFTHKFYCSRANRQQVDTFFEVLTLAMRFLRDFPDDALLSAAYPWLIRKSGVLMAGQNLFATSPEWAAFLKPPHWFGPVEALP